MNEETRKRRGSEDDPIHKALKSAVEVETRGVLWGQATHFVPHVCSAVFGDGRALLELAALNSRPRYYVIRIDSRWKLHGESRAPDDALDVLDVLDDIYDALVADFGHADDETDDDTDDRYREWPAVDLDAGSSWARMDWPELPGVEFGEHPYDPSTNIIGRTEARMRALGREVADA